MSDSSSMSYSKIRHLFPKTDSTSRMEAIINFISSIYEDDRVEKLENQWKYLWCVIAYQGINITKYLAHLLGTRCVYIKSCNDEIDKTRFLKIQIPTEVQIF